MGRAMTNVSGWHRKALQRESRRNGCTASERLLSLKICPDLRATHSYLVIFLHTIHYIPAQEAIFTPVGKNTCENIIKALQNDCKRLQDSKNMQHWQCVLHQLLSLCLMLRTDNFTCQHWIEESGISTYNTNHFSHETLHIFVTVVYCSVKNRHIMRRVVLAVAATHLGFPGCVLSFSTPACLFWDFFLYFLKRLAICCMITCSLPPGGLPCFKKSRVEEEGLGLSWAGLLQPREEMGQSQKTKCGRGCGTVKLVAPAAKLGLGAGEGGIAHHREHGSLSDDWAVL